MATASGLDPALLELGRSMPVVSIPEKLRCVTCDKLALNALRLPCCDNTICADCHDSMTATECPICMHSPFDSTLCVPAKSLQNTIKAFLKTEVKKRASDAAAQSKQSINASIADATPKQAEEHVVLPPVEAASGGERSRRASMETDAPEQHDEPQSTENAESGIKDIDDDDNIVIRVERSEDGDNPNSGDQEEQYEEVQDSGQFQPNDGRMDHFQNTSLEQGMENFQSGNFNGMGGFNPMMSMQAFGMGMPNMMGMPGMGMDPSMMFNGGGFGNGGAGLGEMAMMNMAGMNGGMAGMNGFNGMASPGFFPHQGNFMQSNFGNAQRQFFNNRGYGRPYGRGFGRGGRGMQHGRGRGGWAHHQQYPYHQAQYQTDASAQDLSTNRRGSPSYESMQASGSNAGNNDLVPPTEIEDTTAQNPQSDQAEEAPTNNTDENLADARASEDHAGPSNHVDHPDSYDEGKQENLDPEAAYAGGYEQGLDENLETGDYDGFNDGMQFQQQYGYGTADRGRGGFRGRGGHGYARGQDATELTPAPAPPANAPTGPKAMRQGLPNTGWSGRMSSIPQKQTPVPQGSGTPGDRDLSPAHSKTDDRDRNERSRSRSQSHHRGGKYQEKLADDGYGSDEAYERRKERERRKRKERERRYEDDEYPSIRESEDRKQRSRSESRTDDGSRRRRRDKDDEYRSSRSHRDRSRSRHRRRHRSRSPRKDIDDAGDDYSRRHSRYSEREGSHGDGDRVREKERSSKRSRRNDDHDHDKRDRRHRSSKGRRSARDDDRERDRPRAVIEPPSDEQGFKIKGSRSARAAKDGDMGPPSSIRDRGDRRASTHESASATSAPAIDPYAEERDRAQQAREAREAQRRQSTHSSSLLGKRSSRDDEEIDAPRGPKNDSSRSHKSRKERRINYRYEDEITGDDRDAGRWH